MKHADIIDRHRRHEPAFDLPPRFTVPHDRRLGGRVAARWTRCGVSSRLPPANEMREALAAGGANLVWLRCRDGVTESDDIGATVAATFGIVPGTLTVDAGLGGAMHAAFLLSLSSATPSHFEGAYSRRPGSPPTLLTRGVVVPMADDATARTGCAIVTWTEMLAPADNDCLRRELLSALVAARPMSGPTPVSAMW